MAQTIRIADLPPSIQQQLPMSLRVSKTEYEISDLPGNIQRIVREYIDRGFTVTYRNAFDIEPFISRYGDFEVVGNMEDLVTEYLSNYFQVLPTTYPFDPSFGCRLQLYLNKKDTASISEVIRAETNNICNIISADLGTKISINRTKVTPVNMGDYSMYNIIIEFTINGRVKTITQVIGS